MKLRYIDLFAGIGGFRLAMEQACRNVGAESHCEFSCDINVHCQTQYEANFGERPAGDITRFAAADIPAHDLLLAGFPCQPFSIIGSMKGFEDTRGTLFFDIARILAAAKPAAFVLENVKVLAGHDRGRTMNVIMETLRALNYTVDFRILNALKFGLPQKRERVFIVGFRDGSDGFVWPKGGVPMTPLSEILEKNVPAKFFASPKVRPKRPDRKCDVPGPTIWHENKSRHVSAYPYSCALRAGASYNYLLVNGERRLTPREMLRLQGFPDTFRNVCSDFALRKQAGNSLPVPVAAAVLTEVLRVLETQEGRVCGP